MQNIKQEIDYNEFLEIQKKLDIRIGQVVSAERVPKSDKLLKLTVVFGTDDNDVRTVVTNLGQYFDTDDFLGVRFQFIVNLKPSKMMGITSEAMIMVGEPDNGDLEVLSIELSDFSLGCKIL